MSWRKIITIGALLLAPLFLAQCGAIGEDPNNHIAINQVGPVGPTTPGGYYFELMVTPHTLYTGGWILATVRVWDNWGNETHGVPVYFTITGFNDLKLEATSYTNANGLATNYIEVEADTTAIGYVTALVEGLHLTLPVTILVNVGAE